MLTFTAHSVVQRTLYMMEVEGRNSKDAYDLARKEFYRLRMKQDIERRIAREEAIAVGANFGLSYMEISLENEGKIIDQWRTEAVADFNLRMNKKASAISDSGESEEADVEEAVPLASVFGR
jgi:small subunit ribosomal protein S23